jgi:hypothetical protein
MGQEDVQSTAEKVALGSSFTSAPYTIGSAADKALVAKQDLRIIPLCARYPQT